MLMIASGNAGGQRLFYISVLFILFFKFRFVRMDALCLCMCSVASSSLFFSEVFPVYDFPLLPELWESWEDMTKHSLECGKRLSLLTCEPSLLVETVEP